VWTVLTKTASAERVETAAAAAASMERGRRVRLVGELEGFFAGSSISQNVNGEMREGCRSLHRLIPLRFFWVEFLDDVDAMWVSAGSCALTHSPNQKPTISGLPYMESTLSSK
jgi:hypothetical protein